MKRCAPKFLAILSMPRRTPLKRQSSACRMLRFLKKPNRDMSLRARTMAVLRRRLAVIAPTLTAVRRRAVAATLTPPVKFSRTVVIRRLQVATTIRSRSQVVDRQAHRRAKPRRIVAVGTKKITITTGTARQTVLSSLTSVR